MGSVLPDVAGHRRSPATMPGYHRGRPPHNKGEQYPPTWPGHRPPRESTTARTRLAKLSPGTSHRQRRGCGEHDAEQMLLELVGAD
jgi:hypothetical protein